ncbi:hypothetical protein DMO24_22900, partial [Modestobacter versicolor]
MTTAEPTGLLRRLLALAVLAAAVAAATVLTAAPAAAAPRVTVADESGAARADTTYATTLTVSGTGFQSVSGGFGGIYVLFGWVSGAGWQPSAGGTSGTDYRFVPDSQAAENAGFQRFVAFPGSSTVAEANGGTIAADGSWSTRLMVPGATFQTVDGSGATVPVDCRTVTCGVITIGAHGVVNPANESFTPVAFADLQTTDPGTGPAAEQTTEAPAAGSPAPAAPPAGAPPAATAPAVLIDPATAVAGRVLSFTGSGLVAGEQVLATLDDGVASVGPLLVSAQGTVAGLLELPAELPGGNHELRVTGTTTGGVPVLTFAVESDAGALSVPVAPTASSRPSTAALFFVAAAALVLVVVLTAAVTRRRTRARR